MSIRMRTLCMALALSGAFGAGTASALNPTHVPAANPKVPGMTAPNVLSPELDEHLLATGATMLENPTDLTKYYGYDDNGTMVPVPPSTSEASKTEPDKNTYLVLDGMHGADAKFDYGHRFLFQGHETGTAGYITRINLDADAAHRVTLLADRDAAGNPLPLFDGSTWYPWAGQLLFSSEGGSKGGMWQASPDYPSAVIDISGALGRGGYEGIQADSDGNLIIVEDVGGKSGKVNTHAKQPNSFLYRFVPIDRTDLTKGGKLQALQVWNKAGTAPIVFHDGQPDVDILSQDAFDLHQYGNVFKTLWVTIHDTDVDGMDPFDANALAKAKSATPFKRPENGQFQPGSRFTRFFFDETGDTNKDTEAGANYGGFGSILVLSQSKPSADSGKLTMFYRGDVDHSGFDNVAFWDANHVVFVEDAGDKLHTQRNALDSAYLFDVTTDYSNPANQPIRILAQGRDTSATLDSAFSDAKAAGDTNYASFQNDGDNEITGIHVSDGDAGPGGILGAKKPMPFSKGWRVFYTQQHGDNNTWEIVPNRRPAPPVPPTMP